MKPAAVTGVILAGGQSRRTGGNDKCMLRLHDKPLLLHTIERLAPQVDDIVLCTGPHEKKYPHAGYRQITDAYNEYNGPLAGIQSAMSNCSSDYLFVTACDSPFLPVDLVNRMRKQLAATNKDVAILDDGKQRYPLPCLLKRTLRADLDRYLDSGQRKTATWLYSYAPATLLLPELDPVFININTTEKLAQAETLLRQAPN